MNLAAKVTAAYFESRNMHCQVSGDDGEIIRVGFRGKNKDSLEVLLIFDEGNNSVALRSFGFCKVPENKKANLYKLCSKLNDSFRWVKFYLDDDDTVTAADDAVIQLDSCGEECLELVLRMCKITDEAYPIIMKEVWS